RYIWFHRRRLMKTPDPHANAPRPKRISSDDEPIPDMDHPPVARSDTPTLFDKGVAAADDQARTGQRPGSDDLPAIQAEGTADDPATERSKHPAVPEDTGESNDDEET